MAACSGPDVCQAAPDGLETNSTAHGNSLSQFFVKVCFIPYRSFGYYGFKALLFFFSWNFYCVQISISTSVCVSWDFIFLVLFLVCLIACFMLFSFVFMLSNFVIINTIIIFNLDTSLYLSGRGEQRVRIRVVREVGRIWEELRERK